MKKDQIVLIVIAAVIIVLIIFFTRQPFLPTPPALPDFSETPAPSSLPSVFDGDQVIYAQNIPPPPPLPDFTGTTQPTTPNPAATQLPTVPALPTTGNAPALSVVSQSCGITSGGNFYVFFNRSNGTACSAGFGSGYSASCADGSLQIQFPTNFCQSSASWLSAAQRACANRCAIGAGVGASPRVQSALTKTQVVRTLIGSLVDFTKSSTNISLQLISGFMEQIDQVMKGVVEDLRG